MLSVLKEVCLSGVGKIFPNCSNTVALLYGFVGICYKIVTVTQQSDIQRPKP